MDPSYFVRAKRNETEVFLPIYDVPELAQESPPKTVRQSAINTAVHFRTHGWTDIKVSKA